MNFIKLTKAQDGKTLEINPACIAGMVRTKTIDIPDFQSDAKEVTELFIHGANIIVLESIEKIKKLANGKK